MFDTRIAVTPAVAVAVAVSPGNREGPTSLPQDPKADPAKRKKQLDARKKDYKWSTEVRTAMHYVTLHTRCF